MADQEYKVGDKSVTYDFWFLLYR